MLDRPPVLQGARSIQFDSLEGNALPPDTKVRLHFCNSLQKGEQLRPATKSPFRAHADLHIWQALQVRLRQAFPHTVLLLANMPVPAAPDAWTGSTCRVSQRLAEANLRPTQVQQRLVVQALN